jgi:monothiol glutaredoxin
LVALREGKKQFDTPSGIALELVRSPCYLRGNTPQRSLKPHVKGKIMSGIHDFIANEIKTNDVVLFLKGTPQFPQCGFSGQVVQILDYLGLDYKGVNVLADAEIRQGIKDYSNWPTIPQLYIKGEFVGGCDIVREMFQSGELKTHIEEQGITVRAA